MDNKRAQKFAQFLVKKYGQDGAKKKIEKIQKTGKIDDEDIKDFQKAEQEESKSQTRKAAHGAKLSLIKNLKHQCADDEELFYFKKGGVVGCGCKKKEDGGEIQKGKEGIITRFKNHIKSKFEEAKEKADQIQSQKNYKPDYSSKRVKDSEKDYLEGKGDHKIKKDCGGSKVVAKFKAKCGAKMKKK